MSVVLPYNVWQHTAASIYTVFEFLIVHFISPEIIFSIFVCECSCSMFILSIYCLSCSSPSALFLRAWLLPFGYSIIHRLVRQQPATLFVACSIYAECSCCFYSSQCVSVCSTHLPSQIHVYRDIS